MASICTHSVATARGWSRPSGSRSSTTYSEQIDHIVDTIHFVASHHNGAIQVADCATFVAARMRKIQAGTVQGGPASVAIEELWERRIEPFIYTNSIWYP